MNHATAEFISIHATEDVRQVAFLGSKNPEVDLPFALDQIRGRQMARTKLPRWAATEGIIYPPHLSMEQCSSEFTAEYKANLAFAKVRESEEARLRAPAGLSDEQAQFVDLTGGFGVDFSYIAFRLDVPSLYVEQQESLCRVARENFNLLGLRKAKVICGDGMEELRRLESGLRLVYVDPARRDETGKKVVGLRDCRPDVTLLAKEMLDKASVVIVKLSPMLDWRLAMADLPHVREVHIVSVGNECKELLLVLQKVGQAPVSVCCVNDKQRFCFRLGEHEETEGLPFPESDFFRAPKGKDGCLYLYEPNASLMKAGCFASLSARFAMRMIAQNSHLFVSGELRRDFPGRRFKVLAICSLNKKELRHTFAGMVRANIATRNFPLSVAELRRRLKLRDGGNSYVFGTTLRDGSHVLFVCEKSL